MTFKSPTNASISKPGNESGSGHLERRFPRRESERQWQKAALGVDSRVLGGSGCEACDVYNRSDPEGIIRSCWRRCAEVLFILGPSHRWAILRS
jgi:hypothetical protein